MRNDLEFRKSSYSSAANNCVEIADTSGGAAVRDSKHPRYGHLEFPRPEWTALLGALRNGEL